MAAAFGDLLVDSETVAAFEDVLVDSGTIGAVSSAVCCPTVSVGTLLWTELDVIDVIDVTKFRELLAEDGLILESNGLVDAWSEFEIYERVLELRFSCRQPL